MKNLLHVAYNNDVNGVISALTNWHRQDYLDRSLQIAASRGYTEIVSLLLKDKRAHPEAADCSVRTSQLTADTTKYYALHLAISNGHHEIVDRLLKDGRSDPTYGNFKALKIAIKEQHFTVITNLHRYFNQHRIDYKSKLGTEMNRMLDNILIIGRNYQKELTIESQTYSWF